MIANCCVCGYPLTNGKCGSCRHNKCEMCDEWHFHETYTIDIKKGVDGWWVAECGQLPGCVSQGKTKISCISNIADAIRSVLKIRELSL